MHLPLWLILPLWPLWAWPVTLPLLVGLIVLAVRCRGWRRWLGLSVIAIMVVPLLLAAGFFVFVTSQASARRQAERDGIYSVLTRATTLRGVTLPVGTEMRWSDTSRTHWSVASFPTTFEFHGLPIRRLINRNPDWRVSLAEPRRIGAWTCAATEVTLTEEGGLVSCPLSEAATWQGWRVPAGTTVTQNRYDRTLKLQLVSGGRIESEDGGRSLPLSASLNEDGSPYGAFYPHDEQLEVAGVSLWQQIYWTYDPTTLGQGRNRPPVTVRGVTAKVGAIGPDGGQAWEPAVVTVATGVVERR